VPEIAGNLARHETAARQFKIDLARVDATIPLIGPSIPKSPASTSQTLDDIVVMVDLRGTAAITYLARILQGCEWPRWPMPQSHTLEEVHHENEPNRTFAPQSRI
jgi:hypothetical protein